MDSKVLRLPNGLKGVGNLWFSGSDIEKVIIPNSVESLGESAFSECKQIHEIIFEPGSCLKSIGDCCFAGSGLREIIIPKSISSIGKSAFHNCA